MLRLLVLSCVCLLAVPSLAGEGAGGLPRPHYSPEKTDPEWVKHAVQFHGHFGPMLAFGARMGMAALKAVDAKGYFDVEIRCEGPMAKPPVSCFLDGLQISTGATLGKRNLLWTEGKTIVVHVKNTVSGKTATLKPREEFMALFGKPKADDGGATPSGASRQRDDDHLLEGLSRKIVEMPEKDIVVVVKP